MIEDAQDHRGLSGALSQYLRTEAVGGALLLISTAIALAWANSPWQGGYDAMRDARVGVHWAHLDLTLGAWVQDGLLAVFFFVAGLELKRELTLGDLARPKQALLPVIAATAGVAVPAIIAAVVLAGQSDAGRAWAIPTATDIAFALAVLAVFGSRLPDGARLLLLSIAVIDDLLAIVLIAVLFTKSVSLLWLGGAVAMFAAYWFGQHRRWHTPLFYVPLAAGAWVCVHAAGIHPTLAGLCLGLLTRARPDPGERQAPVGRLEHLLQPFSAGACVPLFALFAAGTTITAETMKALPTERVALAIAIGLLLGKVIGIYGSCVLARVAGLAEWPPGLRHADVLALSVLGAIGFTVCLLMAELTFAGGSAADTAHLESAKLAILLTSLAAAAAGSALMLRRGRT